MAHLVSRDNLVAFYYVFCALCVLNILQWFRIKRFVRSNHPKLWKRFGFWGNPWYVPGSREKQEDDANRSLRIYLFKNHHQLNDPTLAKMVRIQTLLIRLVFLLIIVLISGAFAVTCSAPRLTTGWSDRGAATSMNQGEGR